MPQQPTFSVNLWSGDRDIHHHYVQKNACKAMKTVRKV